MNLVLRELTPADEAVFLKAVQEFHESEGTGFTFALGYKPGMPFRQYLKELEDLHLGRNLPEGYVPGTLLFGFVNEEIVGRLSLRHRLNDFLSKTGGHIGYATVPRFRRKGYATEMLRQALPLARQLGISRILLTCDEGNTGSEKTIEACAGVFEGFTDQEGRSVRIRRYWITP